MRFSQSKRPDWPLEAAATKLAAEAEAWTNGELAETRLSGQAHGLAPWLILNRVAHADLNVLRRVSREESVGTKRRRHRPWATAERSLVHQVLAAAASPDDLVRLQRRVLLPLEMQLVERSKTTNVTLGEVVTATTAALGQPRLDL